MQRPILSLLTTFALLVAACGGDDAATTTTSPSPTTASTVSTTLPTTTAPPTTGLPPPSSTPPRTTPPQTTPPRTTPPQTTQAPPAEPELPVLAVGPGGIEYRGVHDEQEVVGPSLLAVDPSGGFHIHDPVGARILSFTAAGRRTIDLPALDILAVTAMAAGPEHLVVVEIFFSPVRHRVHRVGYDGTLLETIELPAGYRLEDGLSGVLTGSDGEIVIELAGGASYGVWDPDASRFATVATLALSGTTITLVGPDIEINGVLVTTDPTGFGGSRYLGTSADGTVVTVREDVYETDPEFRVMVTVEWYGPDGTFLGSARAPTLADQYTDQAPGLAVGRDGAVYALVAREDAVRIVELQRRPERILDPATTM